MIARAAPIPGRPPVQQRRVATCLRRWIVEGKLAPGRRLPSQQELSQRFRVSGVTIQRTIGELVRDGFLETQPRRGVFVAGGLPYFTNYVLVLPGRFPPEPGGSQFWLALQKEAEALHARGERQLSVVSRWDVAERDERQAGRLLQDVRQHRVAGLILGAVSASMGPTPLLTERGIPRAIISSAPIAGSPCLFPDIAGFIKRALERLAEQGCRRVTLVALPGWAQQQPAFVAACARRRLRAAQPPVLLVAQEQGRGIAQSVELLLRQERARRPDGLIITDDNLVPAATAGIAAAGGPKAGGVKVIAHTNFPWPTPSAVPVMRLGHSVRALLEKCVALIEQQRRGETPPAMTLVPAVFEEEL